MGRPIRDLSDDDLRGVLKSADEKWTPYQAGVLADCITYIIELRGKGKP